MTDVLWTTWSVTAEMAPYLLLGFFIAGLLWKFLRPSWVERHLAGRGIWPSVKATLFGMPMPLCSCGVIPVSASLRQHGASKGATSAFLMATPQTGVDSFFATYALLGPIFAIIRPFAALVTGIIGGGVIDAAVGNEDDANQRAKPQAADEGDCCGDDGCATDSDDRSWWASIRYGMVTLPGDIAVSLLVGLVIAGVITAFVPQDVLPTWASGTVVSMLLMLVVGIPLYVCSTGSIPLALAFIHMGVTPGAALVFLIAGPATNAATIAVTWKVLGRKTAIIYLATIFIAALVSGVAVDLMFTPDALRIPDAAHAHEHGGLAWWQHVTAGALLLMLIGSIVQRRFAGGSQTEASESDTVVQIEGMNCSHCVASATRALREVPGVESADVQLEGGRATVRGKGVDRGALVKAIEGVGFTLTQIDGKAVSS